MVVRIERSRGSLVSIVTGYRLDDRAIEVRSPAEATNGPFPGGKLRPGSDANHSLHLVPKL
jgi:hypothetical protein